MTRRRRTYLSPQVRTRVVLLLGIVLWALLLHDLFWFRTATLLQEESPGYVLSKVLHHRIPAAVLLLAAGIGLLWVVRALRGRPRRKRSLRRRPAFNPTPFLLAAGFVTVAVVLVRSYREASPPLEWSGAAAVTVLASLVLFALASRPRILVGGHVVILVAALGIGSSPRLIPGHGERVDRLEGFLTGEVEHLETKRTAWAGLDPQAVTGEARSRASSRGIYRFDDHLEEMATLEAAEWPPGQGILVDLPRRGGLEWEEQGGEIRPASPGRGIAVAGYEGGALLRSSEPLGIDLSRVGSLLVRMKVSSPGVFRIYWARGDSLDLRVGMQAPLGAPGRFHTYEVRDALLEAKRYRGWNRLNTLWIMPCDRDASVEIDFIRAIDRASTYCRRAPVETGYREIDGETRRVLFARAPSEMTFRVGVPEAAPRLHFGLALADASRPTNCEVEVHDGKGRHLIFSTLVEGDTGWRNHYLDLERWAGTEVDIVFRSRCDSPNVVLWSNPVLLPAEGVALPNLVVYLVDCLRPDHLGAYGYARATSPVLDSLAAGGVTFERAYSNGTHTKHSVPSLFTSNPVTATGVRGMVSVVPDLFPTLAEVLRAGGYSTAAFTSNGIVGSYTGTHRGFSRLFAPQRIDLEGLYAGRDTVTIDAEILIGPLLEEWIRSHASRPFFLFVHTMDAHGPYDPPEPYRRFLEARRAEGRGETSVRRSAYFDPPWVSSPSRESRIDLYDGEIAYGDHHFGRFLGMLEEAGVLDRTLVVFTADHGEYFGEHGMWGHDSPPYVQGTHVPLVISGPGGFRGGVRVRENVQLLDVMPTLLQTAGVTSEDPLFQGSSLVPLAHGKAREEFSGRGIYVEGARPGEPAILHGDFHFLPEKNRVFDLSRDPNEEHLWNEYVFEFGLTSLARRAARTHRETYRALFGRITAGGEPALAVDPHTLRQLRALGYLE